MECVNYVSYSFLFNGESIKSVNFRENFVKEAFYSYILKFYRVCISLSKIKDALSGFKVARCASVINHLFSLTTQYFSIKITLKMFDISKIYDGIEWKFLKCVTRQFGFHHVWIQ